MAKKTRLRLLLLFFIPIVIVIGLIFYSSLYSDNENLKFYNFGNHFNGLDNKRDSIIESDLNNNNNNIFDGNNDSNEFKPKVVQNNEKSVYKFTFNENQESNIDNTKCNAFVSNQTFDINTIDDYNSLEFSPQFKNYWNYSFERKYFEIKQNWNQLPLKVCKHFFSFLSMK